MIRDQHDHRDHQLHLTGKKVRLVRLPIFKLGGLIGIGFTIALIISFGLCPPIQAKIQAKIQGSAQGTIRGVVQKDISNTNTGIHQTAQVPILKATNERGSPTELRGVWLTNIDSGVLFSPAEIRHGVRRLAQLNFNTIYPTVWNWGYTLYPSAIAQTIIGEEIDPHAGLQNRDPLQELVREGHAQGLTVMPWFEFGLMTPSYSELARRHPDWLNQRQDGTSVVMQGRHPRVWLNPLHPSVQDFLVGIITEVVQRYDVDGIQLDDHFGMPVELGYDPYTIERYRQTHHGQTPPSDSNDPEWVQWRADTITRLMERIVAEVRSLDPNCHISLSPNPQPFARDKFLQDWEQWLHLGLLDDLIIQVYRGSVESFIGELERPRLQALKGQLPISIGILSGLRNRPTNNDLIAQQVEAVRDRAFSGVSFFFYESLGDRDSFFQSLFP